MTYALHYFTMRKTWYVVRRKSEPARAIFKSLCLGYKVLQLWLISTLLHALQHNDEHYVHTHTANTLGFSD